MYVAGLVRRRTDPEDFLYYSPGESETEVGAFTKCLFEEGVSGFRKYFASPSRSDFPDIGLTWMEPIRKDFPNLGLKDLLHAQNTLLNRRRIVGLSMLKPLSELTVIR